MSKLLSLDQSSQVTGYAIFDNGELIKYGTIVVKDSDLNVRLVKIRQSIINLLQQYDIDEVILEDIQMQNNVTGNVQTFKTLSEVFGVINELLKELNIETHSAFATQWKNALKIQGRTRQEQKKNTKDYISYIYNIDLTED